MVAVVVVAAEGAGVGQGGGRDDGAQSVPALSLVTTSGKSLSAGVSSINATSGSIAPKVNRVPGASSAEPWKSGQVGGEGCADAGHQHALPTFVKNSRRLLGLIVVFRS